MIPKSTRQGPLKKGIASFLKTPMKGPCSFDSAEWTSSSDSSVILLHAALRKWVPIVPVIGCARCKKAQFAVFQGLVGKKGIQGRYRLSRLGT